MWSTETSGVVIAIPHTRFKGDVVVYDTQIELTKSYQNHINNSEVNSCRCPYCKAYFIIEHPMKKSDDGSHIGLKTVWATPPVFLSIRSILARKWYWIKHDIKLFIVSKLSSKEVR